MINKELARIMANSNKMVTYFIISILISMSGFYIPGEYIIIAFILLAVIAMNFDMEMNRTEAKLLLRGFIGWYVVSDIIKNKLFVYTVVNFIFMLPSIFWGWKWLILGFVFSFLIALFTLYKCYRVKAKWTISKNGGKWRYRNYNGSIRPDRWWYFGRACGRNRRRMWNVDSNALLMYNGHMRI